MASGLDIIAPLVYSVGGVMATQQYDQREFREAEQYLGMIGRRPNRIVAGVRLNGIHRRFRGRVEGGMSEEDALTRAVDEVGKLGQGIVPLLIRDLLNADKGLVAEHGLRLLLPRSVQQLQVASCNRLAQYLQNGGIPEVRLRKGCLSCMAEIPHAARHHVPLLFSILRSDAPERDWALLPLGQIGGEYPGTIDPKMILGLDHCWGPGAVEGGLSLGEFALRKTARPSDLPDLLRVAGDSDSRLRVLLKVARDFGDEGEGVVRDILSAQEQRRSEMQAAEAAWKEDPESASGFVPYGWQKSVKGAQQCVSWVSGDYAAFRPVLREIIDVYLSTRKPVPSGGVSVSLPREYDIGGVFEFLKHHGLLDYADGNRANGYEPSCHARVAWKAGLV